MIWVRDPTLTSASSPRGMLNIWGTMSTYKAALISVHILSSTKREPSVSSLLWVWLLYKLPHLQCLSIFAMFINSLAEQCSEMWDCWAQTIESNTRLFWNGKTPSCNFNVMGCCSWNYEDLTSIRQLIRALSLPHGPHTPVLGSLISVWYIWTDHNWWCSSWTEYCSRWHF